MCRAILRGGPHLDSHCSERSPRFRGLPWWRRICLRESARGVVIPKSKAIIRSRSRTGVASGKARPEERRSGRLIEPLACTRCGAVFRKRAWRHVPLTRALRAQVGWTVCPACMQQSDETYLGRVLVDLRDRAADEAAFRRRIANVAASAGRTQPARRLVSVERRGGVLEVLTTSEKLAHRIAAELAKTWRGRATYVWADDGSLLARWRPAPVTSRARRR